MRVCIQMDPPEGLRLAGDSTFAIALEGARRGHALFWHPPRSLSLGPGGAPRAAVRALEARAAPESLRSAGPAERVALEGFDAVLMRQDPPFDMEYVTAAHLLERLPGGRVFNAPAAVRDAPEKLLRGPAARFAPETLVSDDLAEVRAFARGREVVVKPLHGHAGHGVVRARGADDPNLPPLLESWRRAWAGPPVVQPLLPEIAEGDRRALVVGGRLAGVFNRRPDPSDGRGNLRAGARAEAAEPTAREREAVEAIGPGLAERGILLAGLDFIGPWLTEVNITSPTGLRELEALSGVPAASLFWDALDAALGACGAALETPGGAP